MSELRDEGVAANVFDVTSLDRLHRGSQSQHGLRRGVNTRQPCHIFQLVPPSERSLPVVAVRDAASHSMAWIGSALGARSISLGVDQIGESGTIADLYDVFGLTAEDIVNAALMIDPFTLCPSRLGCADTSE